MGRPLPVRFKKRSLALVRALTDIQLLCHKCHRAGHLSEVSHHRDCIMESRYSGFDELPDYETFAEWEAAMPDEAELHNEDEKHYSRP